MAQCAVLTERGIQFAAENQGFEIVYSLVMSVQSNLKSLMARSSSNTNHHTPVAASPLLPPPQSPPTAQLLILLIDHMNDSRGYTKKLSFWAKQLGLMGIQLFRSPSMASSEHRVEDVIVMLHGCCRDVSEWLCRLRTRKVDVNVRGSACKERKSTVICKLNMASPPPCLLCPDKEQQRQYYRTLQYEDTKNLLDYFRDPKHGLLDVPLALVTGAVQNRF